MKRFATLIFLLLFGVLIYAQDFPLVSMGELYDENPDVNNCYEGKLKDSEKQKAMGFVNYIRSIHNLKPLQYASSFDKETAKSALITVANALLDHFPKSSYHCYTQDGYNGSSTSNLFIMGSYSPAYMPPTEYGIQSWIIDKGIEDIGHRRNLLNPFLKYTSFGRVDGYSKVQSNVFITGMSIKVHQFPDYHNLWDWTPEFVAYPYNDYPSSYFDQSWYLSFTVVADKSNIWNNDNKTVDYSQATVKVADPSNNQLQISNLKYDYQGYGVPNCLYWKTSGLQKEVKYTVTISNVKVNGTPRTFTYWFRITDNPPTTNVQPPTLLSPPDNSADVEIPVTLSWSNVTGAQYYALQVDTNSNFKSPIVDVKSLTTTSYTLSQLYPSIKYYWRVATIKDQQMSNWSPTFSFRTKDVPLAAPMIVSPTDGETSVDLKPTFTWSKVPMADRYHLQVCLDDSFDDFALIINQDNITDTTYTSSVKFFPKSIYYWRVRAAKLTSYSPWSEVKTFWTLDPSTVQLEKNQEQKFIVIDGPDKANIMVNNLQVDFVALFNVLGDMIVLHEGNRSGKVIEIPYHTIASGIWILEIRSSERVQTVYLLIIK